MLIVLLFLENLQLDLEHLTNYPYHNDHIRFYIVPKFLEVLQYNLVQPSPKRFLYFSFSKE